MKPGEALQILVASLERTSEGDDRFQIESPKRLRDVVTGQLREHDVVITFRHGHHETITALECRDRSRPIGVPDIEAFAMKCQRTGVHRPCMVSTKGFAKTAKTTAATMNILCLSLHEAKQFSWMEAPGLVLNTTSVVDIELNFVPEDSAESGGRAELVDVSGAPIPAEKLAQITIDAALRNGTVIEGRNEAVGTFEGLVGNVRTEDGRVVPIKDGWIKVAFDYTRELQPFSFHRYGPADKDGQAFASAEIPGGRIVFARQADGSTNVNLVADPKSQNSPEQEKPTGRKRP